MSAIKSIRHTVRQVTPHWVGDGFPVRSLFSYLDGSQYDPFLLLDYAGPYQFTPATSRRGVGEHPHRGFETVTLVYQGELEHRDSAGHHGTIGAGDVQWMTAAAGVIHEEFHSEAFTRHGGTLEMIQLWVNLPARWKMSRPRYQALIASQIPQVQLPGALGPAAVGTVRVIAGEFQQTPGAAQTFSPLNVWDVQLVGPGQSVWSLPPGHTALLVVQSGACEIQGERLGPGELVCLSREGDQIALTATSPSRLLILTGEPLLEPVVGHGPFVMNTREEIQQAFQDYREGRLGNLS